MILRFSFLALALAAPSYVVAQPAAPRPAPATAVPRPVVQQAAQPLQRSEFLVTMDGEFLKMDADKDGLLTRKEIEDYQRIAAMGAARQRNQQLFAALDADGNKVISPAEFLNLPMNVPAVNPATVLAFDANRDGKVSKIENRAGTLANFDRMDADKDGVITQAEMRAAGLK